MRKAFVGMSVLVLGLALTGIVAGMKLFTQKNSVLSAVIAVADCETNGGTCYPSSWVPNYCSGGVYRPGWPCPQGYKCYQGGSCHAPIPTNTPVPPTPTPVYTCPLNGNYCIPSGDACDPGDIYGQGGTCQPGKTCCLNNPPPGPTNTPPPPTGVPTNVNGYHDGNSGSVTENGGSCSAYGWAWDPTNPSNRVAVRVYVDGVIVWTGTASSFRSDLSWCAGSSCAYNVPLNTLMSMGVTHSIRVSAQDYETLQWVDLSSTPKSLTCIPAPVTNVTGNHAGNSGVQSPANCSAWGTAYDPDNTTQDVNIAVKRDGAQVATGIASSCTGGQCSFSVPLYTQMSGSGYHTISVEAQDNQTGVWTTISNTPRSLSCPLPTSTPTPIPPTPTPTSLPRTVSLRMTSNPDGANVWLEMSVAGGTTTQYILYRCTGATCIPSSVLQSIAPASTIIPQTTTYDDTTGVTPNTYRYIVRANIFNGIDSVFVSSGLVTAVIPPLKPVITAQAGACKPTRVGLGWANVTGATSYDVYKCSGSQCGTEPTGYTKLVTVTGTSYVDTAYTSPGTINNRYYITALNSAGTSLPAYSNQITKVCL